MGWFQHAVRSVLIPLAEASPGPHVSARPDKKDKIYLR